MDGQTDRQTDRQRATEQTDNTERQIYNKPINDS